MFLTVNQTADYLGIRPHQVYYLLFMGYIEAVKVAWTWRVVPESVWEYKEKQAA
jgi:hypothetical protein